MSRLDVPNGLAGTWREHIEPRLAGRGKGLRAPPPAIVSHGAPAAWEREVRAS